jgi:hypothetical protein
VAERAGERLLERAGVAAALLQLPPACMLHDALIYADCCIIMMTWHPMQATS